MQTLRLYANDAGSIKRAARIIRAGGLVAFPTETVYGLGANALDAAAVQKIFAAKERPLWDPLIVHVSSREMLELLTAQLPAQFENLFSTFMPGPLTLVLSKQATVPDVVTAGRNTVAVRFPAHPVAQRLIAASGLPIAAPSANRFQHVSHWKRDSPLHDCRRCYSSALHDSRELLHPSLAPFNLHKSRVRRASGFLLTAFSNASPHAFPYP